MYTPNYDGMRNACAPEQTRAVLGAEQNREVPAVAQAMERLSKAVSFLDEVASTLHERLSPVCRENHVAKTREEPKAPGSSPVCRSIINEAARVESLAESLLAMAHDLEI